MSQQNITNGQTDNELKLLNCKYRNIHYFQKLQKEDVASFSHEYLLSHGYHYLSHGYHYCTTSFNKASTQMLHRFKSCPQRVRDLRWWGSLRMAPVGNKAKCLSSVNLTTKTIHRHHNHHHIRNSLIN